MYIQCCVEASSYDLISVQSWMTNTFRKYWTVLPLSFLIFYISLLQRTKLVLDVICLNKLEEVNHVQYALCFCCVISQNRKIWQLINAAYLMDKVKLWACFPSLWTFPCFGFDLQNCTIFIYSYICVYIYICLYVYI